MRKRFYLIGLLCCILCFSGCEKNKVDNMNHSSDSAKENQVQKNYVDGDIVQITMEENVVLDAKVSIPEELNTLKMNKVNAHRPKLNEKEVKKLFLDGKKIKSREEYDDFKCREFGNYSMINYVGETGERLFYEPANIEFSHSDMDYVLNCLFTDPQFPSYNLDHFSQTEELSFASREKVFKKVKEMFSNLEIPISDEYEVYALDHKQLKKEESPMDTDGNIIEESKKENWTEEDDAYYFILHQEVNGVPIEQIGYGDGYEGTGIEGTVLNAIYGKKGWLSFSEQWGYSLEETNETQTILSVKEAIECFRKKCDMLLLDEKWTVEEISLKLLPVFIKDNDYEVRPVWFFEGSSKDKDQQVERSLLVLFDGITGKEIVL